MSVREKLLEMGAEQGGRKMTIREDGKAKICANFVGGEWVPTAEFESRLGKKSPEERKEDAKADTAQKRAAKPKAAKKKAAKKPASSAGAAAVTGATIAVAEDELTDMGE